MILKIIFIIYIMPHNYNTRNKNHSFDILLDNSKKKSNYSPKQLKVEKFKKEKEKDNNIIDESELKNIIKNNILKHFLLKDGLNDTGDEEIILEYDEDENDYYNSLPNQKKTKIDKLEEEIENINKQSVPYRFKILSTKLPLETKSLLINKLNQFNQLESSDSEYFKLSKWLDTFSQIPFGKLTKSAIGSDNSKEDIKKFLINTKDILDNVIYSHKEAKNQIIEYVCNSISNPNINGKVLAIQGPPGNGKTTLIKNGVAKALKRPFGFVALGGAQDSSFLEGFDYTYEGSKCGKIIDILRKCNCMNPIIYFDELDKISDTPKGEEISNLLCHLIDPSQNNTFYDRYFSEIEIDLSKVTFIFSFNNESLINPILKDRLKIIRTGGYKLDDKINISKQFLIPECLKNINLDNQIIFDDKILKYIITIFTNTEKGVRELKRNIEEICSKINLYSYLNCNKNETIESDTVKYNIIKKIDNKNQSELINFEIENFKLPIKITSELIDLILVRNSINDSIAHIYL